MQFYAITDRRLPGSDSEQERLARLAVLAAGWARGGVEYIQVRDKALGAAGLISTAGAVVDAVKGGKLDAGASTCVLVNAGMLDWPQALAIKFAARAAAEAGADGIHLTGGFTEEFVESVRGCWSVGVISVACHSTADVQRARRAGVDLILFAPVFGKNIDGGDVLPGVGLKPLEGACAAAVNVPVFALGGVTLENAADCTGAGAAGVAGIRLFAADDWKRLR